MRWQNPYVLSQMEKGRLLITAPPKHTHMQTHTPLPLLKFYFWLCCALLCQRRSVESKLWFFPVVMYGCKSWTIKKAECWRTDAFELCCWRRLLRVPWTARRSNQSILKNINPEYSLVGLMLKLKLQYFGHLMQREDTFEKTLMLGKTECRGEEDERGWDDWVASPTQWTWVWASSGRWWRTGKPGMLQSMLSQRVGYDWATDQQQQIPCIVWDLSSLTRDQTCAPAVRAQS